MGKTIDLIRHGQSTFNAHWEATLEDPLTYSKPWTIEMPLYRVIDQNAQLLEHKCVPFTDKLLYSDLMGLTPSRVK